MSMTIALEITALPAVVVASAGNEPGLHAPRRCYASSAGLRSAFQDPPSRFDKGLR